MKQQTHNDKIWYYVYSINIPQNVVILYPYFVMHYNDGP